MEQERWKQTQEIFHAALEREASQRSAYLTQACADDPALRQEVEAVLAGNEQAGSFPDSINPAVIATLIGESEDPYQTALLEERNYVGQVIGGHYLIKERFNGGGFGDIYLAEDQEFRAKRVVVKMLRSEAARDPHLRRKFEGEIDALRLLDHPNIVKGLATGYLPDGACYLVEELIKGQTLRAALEKALKKELQGLDLPRVAGIMSQLGRALSAAHHNGIVHRDLKPENVMWQDLQDSGAGEEHIKLLDFGIATVRDPNLSGPQRSTRVIGTLPYMAPEQMLGKPEAASDIWSLGVMAYELVTGKLPFNGETPIELYRQQEAGVPPDKLPQKLRHDLLEAAQRAIVKALAFKPEDRYQRVQDFTEELAHALSEPTIKDVPVGVESSRLRWLLPALVALVISVASGWYLLYTPRVVALIVEPRGTLQAHDWVLGVALSPNGQRIAAADVDNVIHLSQVSDGSVPGPQLILKGLAAPARCVAISPNGPNGQMVAAGSDDGEIGLWRVDDGDLVFPKVWRGHQTWVFSISFSRDGQTLVSASDDGVVQIWGLNGESKMASAMKRRDQEMIAAIHPDLNLVAVSDRDGNQKTVLRSVTDHSLQKLLQGSAFKVSRGAFNMDGQLLALGGQDGAIRVYRVSDGSRVKTLDSSNGAVRSVVFSSTRQMIASGYEDGTIKLWRESDGGLSKEWNGHRGKVWSLAFSVDGQRLVSGGEDKTVQLWQIREKTQ